jgi:hypothetical protein
MLIYVLARLNVRSAYYNFLEFWGLKRFILDGIGVQIHAFHTADFYI